MFTIPQADPETDEVYAQMTLQPVPSVRTLFRSTRILFCNKNYTDALVFLDRLCLCSLECQENSEV